MAHSRNVNSTICSELMRPNSVDEFFDQYFEANWLHIPTVGGRDFENWLSISDLESYLEQKRILASDIRVSQNGQNVAVGKWTYTETDRSGRSGAKTIRFVNSEKLFELMTEGATVVFFKLEHFLPELKSRCSQLSKELNIGVHANVYFTPRHACAFEPHFDPHDLFILQTFGTKKWRIYGSPEVLPDRYPDEETYKPLKPLKEIELKEGDVLYLPRGCWHNAETTDTQSVHIALGLHGQKKYQLFDQLSKVLYQNPSYRNMVRSTMKGDDWRKLMMEMLDKVDDSVLENMLNTGPIGFDTPSSTIRFRDLLNLHLVNTQTRLCIADGITYEYSKGKKFSHIHFADKIVPIPAFIENVEQLLIRKEPFRVEEIGVNLPSTAQVQLAKNLVKNGLIQIVNINQESVKQ